MPSTASNYTLCMPFFLLRIFVCLLLSYLLGCSSPNTSFDFIQHPEKFVEQDWNFDFKSDSIPLAYIDYVERAKKRRFSMADFGEPYQSTDMIDDPLLTNKQLCFIGHLGNQCMIVYRHGGIGAHVDITMFRMVNGRLIDLKWTGSGNDISNVTELKNELKNGNMRLNETDSLKLFKHHL